jgi:DNA-binding NtrC family response regulator
VSDADIIAALQAEGYRRERAAKRLGVSKSYLYKRLQGSPASRSVQDISTDEIRSALSDCGGDVGAAAERLRVSGRALRLQLKRIEPPSA